MVKLLVAGVLVVMMGVVISRTTSGSAPTDPVQAQTQVDKARQDINSAVSVENQRAVDLNINTLGSQPSSP